MFNHLIESDSHRDEFKRRGSFFLGTLILYALLFFAAGVLSIYAYDVRLENQSLEMLTLLTPVEMVQPTAAPPARDARPKPTESNRNPIEADIRRTLIASTDRPNLVPREVSSKPSDIPTVREGIPTVLGDVDRNARNVGAPIGPTGPGVAGVPTSTTPSQIHEDTPPPPLTPKANAAQPKAPISLGVLVSKIISKPNPPYPALAKQARVQGTVTVQIVVDESGKVISSKAISGPPLLRSSAEQAAYQTRFTPTLLSHEPVKVSGTITFNYMLQ